MASKQKEEENFHRACNIVLDLCAQAQRDVLEYYVPALKCPTTLTGFTLNPYQRSIFGNIHIKGSYEDCDVSLLYILLRNLIPRHHGFRPTRRWGADPRATHQSCADDVGERVRKHRNTLVCHASATRISDAVYKTLITEMQDVMTRLDGGYGGTIKLSLQGTYANLFKALCSNPLETRIDAEISCIKACLAHGLQDADGRLTTLEAQVQKLDQEHSKQTSDLALLSTKVDDLIMTEEKHDILIKSISKRALHTLPAKLIRRLSKSMSDNSPDLWFYLLSDFGFSRKTVNEIERKVLGSSNPVRKFIDLLMDEETLTIDQVLDALIGSKMFKANETLQYIRKGCTYFNELMPREYEQLYEHFYGNGGFHLVEGWQDLLMYLGLSKHIDYVESLGLGIYTCEKGLFDILANTTIGEFYEKLLGIDKVRNIPKVDLVRQELDEVLQALSTPALDLQKLIRKDTITLYFSCEALKTRYGWFWLPSPFQTSMLTKKDCKKDSPLLKSIKNSITDSFDHFMTSSCESFKSDQCHIHFDKPELVTDGNYLLLKLIIKSRDSGQIPEVYHSYGTPESEELWNLLKSAIGKASYFADCDVHIGLEEWYVGSIVITISMTKIVKCLWREEETCIIKEKIQEYINETNLPSNLQLYSVVPDIYLKYECEIMTFSQVTANTVARLLHSIEEYLVGHTVNGSPSISDNVSNKNLLEQHATDNNKSITSTKRLSVHGTTKVMEDERKIADSLQRSTASISDQGGLRLADKNVTNALQLTRIAHIDGAEDNQFDFKISSPAVTPGRSLKENRLDAPHTPKRYNITQDYTITRPALNIAINGKVLQCFKKDDNKNKKYDLRVLKNSFKARQEIELHWKASGSPFIVKIIDVYENRYRNDDILLVVMECVEEGELFDWVKSRGETPFTERDAAAIVRIIASALMHLHSIDIAHRNIKPENLLYQTKNGKSSFKLTDFKFAEDTSSTSSRTPLPPNVLESDKSDKSCDMWSLGVITYILLCGYPPFYRKHMVHPGMKDLIRAGQYNFNDSEWKNISNDARELVKGLLVTEASQRLTIKQVMEHPWILHTTAVQDTPLHTTNLLNEDINMIWDVSDSMSEELQKMRSPPLDIIHLKGLNLSKNPLIERRKKKKPQIK